jgi:hypothetical protein
MKLIILFLLSDVFAQQMSNDPLVQLVIKENKQLCRNTYPPICIKPVNKSGTDIKAMEIALTGTTKVNITLYDKNGSPHDLEPENQIQFKGVDDTFDADIAIGKPSVLIKKQPKIKHP